MQRNMTVLKTAFWIGAGYFFAPVSMAGELAAGIWAGDSPEQVATVADGYECSLLLAGDGQPSPSIGERTQVYCFDQDLPLGIRDGQSRVYFDGNKASRLVVEYPLSASTYTSVLASLRRQGFVFVSLEVADERLDVLAGLQSLDAQTLDSQLFALANRYDYRVSRRYMMVDNNSYRRAQQAGITNVQDLLNGMHKTQYSGSQVAELVVSDGVLAVTYQ